MTFTCTVQPCTSVKLEAKGMCRKHYKQTRPRTPDKPKVRECTGCGAPTPRLSSSKYTKTYCSELCRHWVQWGAWSVPLPKPRTPKAHAPKATTVKRDVSCSWCGASFQTGYTRAKFCSRQCSRRNDRTTRRALEHHALGTYTWMQVTRLWKSFDKACAYCCMPTPLTQIQAEHVHPLSRGGRNDIGNLLPSCGHCNRDKRALLLDEWAADRQRRGLAMVHTTWDQHDKRYAHIVTHQA